MSRFFAEWRTYVGLVLIAAAVAASGLIFEDFFTEWGSELAAGGLLVMVIALGSRKDRLEEQAEEQATLNATRMNNANSSILNVSYLAATMPYLGSLIRDHLSEAVITFTPVMETTTSRDGELTDCRMMICSRGRMCFMLVADLGNQQIEVRDAANVLLTRFNVYELTASLRRGLVSDEMRDQIASIELKFVKKGTG